MNTSASLRSNLSPLALATLLIALSLHPAAGAEKESSPKAPDHKPSGGPGITVNPHPHERGDAVAGKDVFRFETFGNEGFWTDAARMPKGMADAKLTPKQALEAGLQVDIEAIDPAMREAMAKELKTDLSPANAPMLHDPMVTVKLIEANAVAGIVAVDSNGDGKIQIAPAGPDKVGISCAICHTVTDKSVFELPGAGSIGKRIDGLAATTLDAGKLFAMAANSRALYPNTHAWLGLGKTVGRGMKPLSADSTEAEFDAFFTDRTLYPVGTFDETQDGNGNPVINTALFRQDLAAPYGTAGEFSKLDDISNGSFTTNLDPTTLLTPEGRAFLKIKAGELGEKLADEYEKILKATGVTGHPFVKAKMQGKAGEPANIVGRRVDEKKLLDMNAYLDALPAPKGAAVEPALVARGRELFESNCTSCHNSDQSKFVPPTLVELKKIWPGYKPVVAMKRQAPLSPIQNSFGIYDDKMIVVDASDRGENRGVALPLLLDLARRNVFLHDASVTGGLDHLLNPERGENAPHPFYFKDQQERNAVIGFLKSLDTGEEPAKTAQR